MATNPAQLFDPRSYRERLDSVRAQLPQAPTVPMQAFGLPETPAFGLPAMPAPGMFDNVQGGVTSTEQPMEPTAPQGVDPLARFKEWASRQNVSPDNYADLAEKFWAVEAEPRLRQRRGVTQGLIDAHKTRFDALVEDWAQQAWGQAPAEGAGTEAGEGGWVRPSALLWDTPVRIATAIGLGVPASLFGLADTGTRIEKNLRRDLKAAFGIGSDGETAEQRRARRRAGQDAARDALARLLEDGDTKAFSDWWRTVVENLVGGTDQTWMGDVSQGLNTARQAINDFITTEQTAANIDEFGRRVAGPDRGNQPILEWARSELGDLGSALDFARRNPTAALPLLESVAQMLVPAGVVGRAGAATAPARGTGMVLRTPQVAASGYLRQNRPVIAGGAVAGGQAGVDATAQVMATPVEQLLENPDNQRIYNDLAAMGLRGEALDTAFKERVAVLNAATVTPVSLVANTVIPALAGGRGLERIVGGTGATGATTRLGAAGRTAAAQAVEEPASEVLDTIGQNLGEAVVTGEDVPLMRGTITSGGIGAVVGAGTGAGVGFAAGPRRSLRSPQQPPPGATPPPTDPNAPAAPTARRARPAPAATDAAPTEVPPGAGLNADDAAATIAQARQAAAGVLKRKNLKDAIASFTTPQQVWDEARTRVQAALGDRWAQMTEAQRIDATEAAAERLNAVAKVDGFGEFVAGLRASTTPDVPTEQVAQQPLPEDLTDDAVAAAAAAVEEAPATVEETPAAAEEAPAGVDVVADEAVEVPTTDTAQAPPVEQTAPDQATDTAQAPAAAVAEEAAVAEQAVEAPATERPGPRRGLRARASQLPAGLAGERARYNRGTKVFRPEFASAVDRAIYASTGKQKDKYIAWLAEQGVPKEEIAQRRRALVARIKAATEGMQGGTQMRPQRVHIAEESPPSPNAEAPAPVVEEAGAAVEAAEPAPIGEAPPVEQTVPDQGTTTAASIVGDDVTASELADIEAAIALAQEGAPQELLALTSQMVRDEIITREQARALNALGRETRREGERVAADDQAALDAVARAVLDEETVRTGADPAADGGGDTSSRTPLAQALRRILASDSNTKAEDLLMAVANDESLPRYERLLARKLAPLMTRFGVQLRPSSANALMSVRLPNGRPKYGGVYMRGENAVYINKPDAETILHEMLHAATSNLLAVRGQRARGIPRLKELQNEFDELLEALRAHVAEVGLESMPADARRILSMEKGPLADVQELLAYGLTSPTMQDVLANIPAPPSRSKVRNLWQWFKNALAEFFSSISGSVLRRSKRDAQEIPRSFLDALIESTADLVDFGSSNPEVVAAVNEDAARILGAGKSDPALADFSAAPPEAITNADVTAVTASQRFGERYLQRVFGLEKSERAVIRAGGTVTDANRPSDAAIRLDGQKADIARTDNTEITEPVLNYFAANWQRFGETPEAALENLNSFFQAQHGLERMDTLYDLTVALNGRGAVQRAEILDGLADGSIAPADARAQLQALVDAQASQSFDEWAESRYRGEYNPKALEATLAELAQQGVTAETVAEMNTLLDAARERVRQRLVQAGQFADSDPWAEFYGWKYYVPLKGEAGARADAELDYDGRDGMLSMSILNKQMRAQEGRRTFAEKPLNQLLVDVRRAADTAATNEFERVLYEYVLENEQLLGATITPFEGGYKTGFTNLETGEVLTDLKRALQQREVDGEQVPGGFIYNDGTTHYVVQLPQGSQLLRALTKMAAEIDPADTHRINGVPWLSVVGKGTNILSKAYTTFDPTWQLMVGFMRDTNYLPATIGVSNYSSPLKAAPFFGRYIWNLAKSYKAIRTFPAQVLAGDYAAMQRMAKEDPNSFAAWLLRMRAAGGGTDYISQFNNESLGNEILKAAKDSDGIRMLPKRGYNAYVNLTDNWAAFLENIGRVAAFKSLVENGETDARAAAIVKGAMNYQQSGTHGRLINSFLAFYRVGATSVDVMRKAFVKPNGDWDFVKMRNWAPFFAAIGATYYMLMREMLGDDEEQRDEKGRPIPNIRKYRPSTLTQKMLFPIGDDAVGGYAIGLGLPQILLAPGVLGAAVSMGDMSLDDAVREYRETLERNAPVRPAGVREGTGLHGWISSWLQAAVPTVAVPLRDLTFNTSAFGTPIRTDFPRPGVNAADQGMPHTPQEFKNIAQWLQSNVGIDMYPETIQYLASNYGGQVAGQVIRGVLAQDEREAAGMEPSAVRTLGRFQVADAETYLRRRYINVRDELREASRRYGAVANREGEDAAKRLLRTDATLRRQIDALKALEKANRTHSDAIKAIQANRLWSVEGKRMRRKRADSELRQAIEAAERATGSRTPAGATR